MPESDRSPNRATYHRPEQVRRYARLQELFPAERLIFDRFHSQFGGDVLDIAIGAGRTTRALLGRSRRYVGLDFAAGMVQAAQQNFPQADLRQMDMRDVPHRFAGEQFDAILISFNGIDLIPWDDRNSLLGSLRGLLRTDGVLVFSAHDLAVAGQERGFHIRPDLRVDWATVRARPITLVKAAVRLPAWLPKAYLNHVRNRRLEQSFDGYAYINDNADNYGLLTVYVDTDKQVEILQRCGYRGVEMFQPWLGEQQSYFNYFTCLG